MTRHSSFLQLSLKNLNIKYPLNYIHGRAGDVRNESKYQKDYVQVMTSKKCTSQDPNVTVFDSISLKDLFD